MTKFAFNPRTCQVEAVVPERPNANQVFKQVKSRMGRELERIEMSDTELRDLVTKMMAGTRNIMYLGRDYEERRRIDVIVRAINNFYPM
jgi:glutathione synthase/RimK-type ligase-like ATP-grasp enzyme